MDKLKSVKAKPPSHSFRVSTDDVRLRFVQERATSMHDRLTRRRELASVLTGEALVTIPREDGYAILPAGLLELGPVLEESHRLLAYADIAKKKADAHKAFLVSLADQAAWTLQSPILQLGRRRDIIAAATAYLGMVPILQYANIMYSSYTGDELAKSQLYHCDSDETEQVKVFVLCEEVTAATGPLTFIAAHQSKLVRDRTAYRYKTRLSDQQVHESLGGLDPAIALTGPPGTTAFIDTSRCLHYGSRLQDISARRLVVMLQYVTPLAFLYTKDHRESARFRHLASSETDEVMALVLGAQ